MTQQLAPSSVEKDVDVEERAPSKRHLRTRFYLLLAAADASALGLGFAGASLVRSGAAGQLQGWTLLAILLPLFWGLAFNGKTYSADVLEDWRRGISPVLTALGMAVVTLTFVGFLLKASTGVSRLMFATAIVSSTVLILAARAIIGRRSAIAFRGAAMSRVLITDGADCPCPPEVHCVAADRLELQATTLDPFMLDRLGRYLEAADSVVVACAPEKRVAWSAALKGANIHGELAVPELDAIGGLGTTRFGQTATMLVSAGPLSIRDQIMKRALDLVIVIPALLFLAPLMLFVALAIRFDSAGPAFFVQQRVGRGNKLFPVYKFRSMRTEQCDSDGVRSTGRDDDRVTRVGRFIRATSIDELPQLLNVLQGEMSLVGPRPHALGSLAGDQLFWEVDARYWHRHACKPGLTGLAQVRGFRGATPNREDLLNRLQADLEYLNRWSVWEDLSIILATVKVVVHPNAF